MAQAFMSPALAAAPNSSHAANNGFVSNVPINMLLEPSLYKQTMDSDLETKLLHLTTMIADQRDTVMQLTENQRRMDELRALALVCLVISLGSKRNGVL